MRVTMFWYGGTNYGLPDIGSESDAEVYDSLREAKLAFQERLNHPYYPCVAAVPPDEGGPEGWVYFGVPDEEQSSPIDITAPCPNRILRCGRRGQVVVER